MAFKAWSAFVDERDPIKVRCTPDGTEYVLPELAANVAHQYRLLGEDKNAAVPMQKWSTDDERVNVLGEDLVLQMMEDCVPDAFIARCVSLVILDWHYGRDVAEAAWERGVDPKELASLVAAKIIQAQGAGGTASPSSDAGSETPKASSSGTTSRKDTKRAPSRPRKNATGAAGGRGSRTTGSTSKRTG